MATFNAGTGNQFTNVIVGDHIDARGSQFTNNSRADPDLISAILVAAARSEIPTADFVATVGRLERSGGIGRTPETRAFYEALKKIISVGGETIRTIPGMQILLEHLRSLFS